MEGFTSSLVVSVNSNLTDRSCTIYAMAVLLTFTTTGLRNSKSTSLMHKTPATSAILEALLHKSAISSRVKDEFELFIFTVYAENTISR